MEVQLAPIGRVQFKVILGDCYEVIASVGDIQGVVVLDKDQEFLNSDGTNLAQGYLVEAQQEAFQDLLKVMDAFRRRIPTEQQLEVFQRSARDRIWDEQKAAGKRAFTNSHLWTDEEFDMASLRLHIEENHIESSLQELTDEAIAAWEELKNSLLSGEEIEEITAQLEQNAEDYYTKLHEMADWIEEAKSLLPRRVKITPEIETRLEEAFRQGKTSPQEAIDHLF